jgi:hypothetical protein
MMLFMKSNRMVLALFALLPALASAAAPACDSKAKVPDTARTFAKTSNEDNWREYRNIEAVPDLSLDGAASAQFWQDQDGVLSALIVEPGEDFWIYTRSCFNRGGKLVGVAFEVRTAWGWSFREDGIIVKGQLQTVSSGFFNTENDQKTPRPDAADDIADALRPTLYFETTKLPFAALLNRNPTTKPK